jgi:hypothetical protein
MRLRVTERPYRLLYNGAIMKRLLSITGILLALILLASSALNAQASQPSQTLITPTPGADGRILYVVQEGQTCTYIALLAGIPIAQLRSLNRLDENCTLRVGQELLIGMGGPTGSTPTPETIITPTPPLPSPTPNQGEASVCVLLYDDLNGDGLRQDTEVTISNGAVSVTGTSGQFSETATTTTSVDPLCFNKVIEGSYNISVAAPEGYNPTTQLNYSLNIKAGEQIFVDFGAQVAGETQTNEQPVNEPGNNNLLGIAGAILVISAAGLGIYAWLVYGRKPSYDLNKPPNS